MPTAREHLVDSEPIEIIGIPTRDRPKMLARHLRSLVLSHVADPSTTIVVVDDSSNSLYAQQNSSVVSTFARNTQYAWKYIAPQQRGSLATHIAQACSPELASFAIIGYPPLRGAGAPRNLLHLIADSRRGLFADDDTLYHFCTPPDKHTAMFNTRFLLTQDNDAPHWLDSQEALAMFRTTLSVFRNPVSIITAGVYGDSGRWSEAGFIVDSCRPTLERMWHYNDYNIRMRSRRVHHAAGQLLHTRIPQFQSFIYAADLCKGLPPFFPVGRNSDGVFARVMMASDSSAQLIHLPIAIEHLPGTPRTGYIPLSKTFAVPRISDYLILCLNYIRTQTTGSNRGLSSLGNALADITKLSPAAFRCHLAILLQSAHSAIALQLESLIAEPLGSAPWKNDLCILRDSLKHTSSQQLPIPYELRELGISSESALLCLQQLIASYGSLLLHWTSMRDTLRDTLRSVPTV